MMQGSLARRLRVLRAERGLSLRKAATLTGVAKETISDIERGLRHPHDPTLAKIAKGYGVPVEDLLEEPVPLDEAPQETGPSLLEKALDAVRQDEEKEARAKRRGAASEGVAPTTGVAEFEEDKFSAELRARGFPDEYFGSFIWPLVLEAREAERLEQEVSRIQEDLRDRDQKIRRLEEERVRLQQEIAQLAEVLEKVAPQAP